MAVKYRIEYQDTEDVNHKLDIDEDGYVGSVIEINGNIFLDYAQTENLLEPIRGNGLRIDLEADDNQTFNELFESSERTYLVEYQRNSIVLFNGWINPDGYYESFVNDRWVVSLDCVDGLSFLDSLSYVNNTTGLFFTGKQSQLEVIVNCLKRTGINENINTNIDIYYTGLSTSLDVLDNVYVNTERFVKDDGETIMSCLEVLKDTLEPYAACITMYEGEWFIYKPNQIYADSTPTFFRYDYTGAALSPTTATKDISVDLGSQIDSFDIHHANTNQSKTIDRGLGAFRINYKYGFSEAFLSNIYLGHNGSTIDEWTINSNTNLVLDASGNGVELEFNTTTDVLNLTSDVTAITKDDTLNFVLKYTTIGATSSPPDLEEDGKFAEFQYLIKIDTGAFIYYYNVASQTWDTPSDIQLNDVLAVDTVHEINTTILPPPNPGDIYIEIRTPQGISGTSPTYTTNGAVLLTEIRLSPKDTEERVVEGEIHTFQRTDNPSTKTELKTEIFTGDNVSATFIGALYKTDELTPTESWFRKGVTESFPIVRIMGEETMRMNQSNAIVFSGDVYGYFPYMSLVDINNVGDYFMPIEYSL